VFVSPDPGLADGSGFTLIELIAVLAIALTLSAITVPAVGTFSKMRQAGNAARLVERELQTARLKAVTISRAVRVRFNCPSAGKLRLLELTGVATTDNAANRCDPTAYPWPGPNDSLRSTPMHDSPVIDLPSGTTITGTAMQFEFNPTGAAYSVASNGTVSMIDPDITLTVTRTGFSKTITINGLGRVRLN
jgi:prepilin-type N-terminal cleavage/methylation domain-containing protein